MKLKTIQPRHAAFFIMLFVFLIGFGNFASGQQNRSSISGFVYDPERRTVPDVYVELLDEVNSVLQRVRTNGSGRYFFSGLSSGRFTIRVLAMASNLEGRPEDVEIAGIGMSGRPLADNVQKDMYLHYRKSDSDTNQLTGVVYAQSVPAEAQAAYKKAVSDIDNNKIDTGIEGLQHALAVFPDYLVALEKLGMTKLAQSKYDEAFEIFTRAIAVYDRSFSSWYGLAYAGYSLKKYDESAKASEKAVAINSNSLKAYLLLGLALRNLKEYTRAEAALLKSIKASDGNAPDAHWNLALLYAHDLKRFKEAADHLELYMKQSPDLENKETIKKLIKQFRDQARAA